MLILCILKQASIPLSGLKSSEMFLQAPECYYAPTLCGRYDPNQSEIFISRSSLYDVTAYSVPGYQEDKEEFSFLDITDPQGMSL